MTPFRSRKVKHLPGGEILAPHSLHVLQGR